MGNTKVKYSFAEWCRDNDHQDWLDRWDYELNEIGPEEVAYRSNKKFYFKCPRGIHKSELKIPSNLVSGRTHLFCNQCASFGQWLIDTYGEHSLDLYWSDKNIMSPMHISKCSGKKVWIKCINNLEHSDYLTAPYNFVSGDRCTVCSNKKIISGINDIATTHPEFVKYFKFPSDATIYSIRSGKYVWFKCPECGCEKYISVDSAFEYGHYSCLSCKDGVSYANKFIYCFLKQLQDKHKFVVIPEKVFEWSKKLNNSLSKRVYDFYVDNNCQIIIEAHGKQHYEHGFDLTCGGRSLEEEQANDLFKYNLAVQNGIHKDKYVVLDCRESDVEFIRNSIMTSNLPQLLGFNDGDIDWNQCGVFATKNYIKMACNLWSSGIDRLQDIAEKLGVSRSTVSSYLKKGDKLNLIIYESKANKPILCNNNNYVFACSSICSKRSVELFGVFLSRKGINASANGEIKTTHGFQFSYITHEEMRRIQNTEPHRVIE